MVFHAKEAEDHPSTATIDFPLAFYHIPQVHQVAQLINCLAATARKKPDAEKWTEFKEHTRPLTDNLPSFF